MSRRPAMCVVTTTPQVGWAVTLTLKENMDVLFTCIVNYSSN